MKEKKNLYNSFVVYKSWFASWIWAYFIGNKCYLLMSKGDYNLQGAINKLEYAILKYLGQEGDEDPFKLEVQKTYGVFSWIMENFFWIDRYVITLSDKKNRHNPHIHSPRIYWSLSKAQYDLQVIEEHFKTAERVIVRDESGKL